MGIIGELLKVYRWLDPIPEFDLVGLDALV